jgi:WD40 repeat protein
VSISTDGRVTQWSIAKGLEFSDLMKLKRMARRGAGGPPTTSAAATAKDGGGAKAAAAVPEQQDAFISRLTSGMAFDFSSRDERIYVAATEDGWLHKCSTSYSEQYLESYRGHMGPVYQVQFSPFKRDMFISASGDWTIRMWQEGRDTPLLTFQASTTEVNDVQWCPTNSTVFGSVTANGRLEVGLALVSPLGMSLFTVATDRQTLGAARRSLGVTFSSLHLCQGSSICGSRPARLWCEGWLPPSCPCSPGTSGSPFM